MATGPVGAFNFMGQLGKLGEMSPEEIAVGTAKKYREFEEEHPLRGLLVAATPGIGQISNVALALDPRLSVREKLVEGTVGEIGGRAAGKAANKAITIGSRGIANLIRSGLTDKILGKGEAKIYNIDTRTGKPVLHRSMELAELNDINWMLRSSATDPTFKGGKLDDLIDAPELFEAYPYLKNLKVEFADELSDYRGGIYYPDESAKGGLISITGTRQVDHPGLLKTILHETQHAIQTREGWDSMFRGSNYNTEGLRKYWTNPGEAQARVTEIRKGWTDAERAALPKFVHDKAEIVRSNIEAKVAEAFGVDVDSPLDKTAKNTAGTIAHYMKNRQFVGDNLGLVVPHWRKGQVAGNLAMLAKMDEPTQDLMAKKLILLKEEDYFTKLEKARRAQTLAAAKQLERVRDK